VLIRTASRVNAELVAVGGVGAVDEDGVEVGAEEEGDDEEGNAVSANEALVDSEDGDGVEDDCEDNTVEAMLVDVVVGDERTPTLTPNGAVADALALVWDIKVVLALSGIDPVEADVAAVKLFELNDVLTSAAELVLEMGSDVARESKLDIDIVLVVPMVVDVVGSVAIDTPKLEDEYTVIVDVESIYSVVVENIVTVVQVVPDCAAVRPIHAPMASQIVLFMINLCEAAGCAVQGKSQVVEYFKILSRRMETQKGRETQR